MQLLTALCSDRLIEGIGTMLASDLIVLAHKYFPDKDVIIRVRENNTVSQHVAEKCGGLLIGYEAPPEIKYTQSVLEKYGDENNSPFSSEELAQMRAMVEQRKQEVRIYKMP